MVKQLTRDTDTLTLMVWGAVGQAALSLPFAMIHWRAPQGEDWLFLSLLGENIARVLG